MPPGSRPRRVRASSRPGGEGDAGDPRVEQRQQRVRGGAAEQLDDAGVGQAAPARRRRRAARWSAAASSARGGGAELDARQPPGVRVAALGEVLGAQLPVGEPGGEAGEAVRVVELVGEDRREAEGDDVAVALGGQPLEDPHQRQVAAGPRLVEPLLTDRPAPVVRQPGQVGVEDEAERPDGLLRTAEPRRAAPGRGCRPPRGGPRRRSPARLRRPAPRPGCRLPGAAAGGRRPGRRRPLPAARLPRPGCRRPCRRPVAGGRVVAGAVGGGAVLPARLPAAAAARVSSPAGVGAAPSAVTRQPCGRPARGRAPASPDPRRPAARQVTRGRRRRSRRPVTDVTRSATAAGHSSGGVRSWAATTSPCSASQAASRAPWTTPSTDSTLRCGGDRVPQLRGVELPHVVRVRRTSCRRRGPGRTPAGSASSR